ncbi:hypothetical protein JKP88DRAFT_289542 [Tribonema minus]|uniref:Uncharacterized protein n=1 Tax=Tribonema minus TaxID=303371 RepID=A0A835ZA01_9STRA|nr:hypothetical protein JKP88DRAFT_289542 [Tribonema minus]
MEHQLLVGQPQPGSLKFLGLACTQEGVLIFYHLRYQVAMKKLARIFGGVVSLPVVVLPFEARDHTLVQERIGMPGGIIEFIHLTKFALPDRHRDHTFVQERIGMPGGIVAAMPDHTLVQERIGSYIDRAVPAAAVDIVQGSRVSIGLNARVGERVAVEYVYSKYGHDALEVATKAAEQIRARGFDVNVVPDDYYDRVNLEISWPPVDMPRFMTFKHSKLAPPRSRIVNLEGRRVMAFGHSKLLSTGCAVCDADDTVGRRKRTARDDVAKRLENMVTFLEETGNAEGDEDQEHEMSSDEEVARTSAKPMGERGGDFAVRQHHIVDFDTVPDDAEGECEDDESHSKPRAPRGDVAWQLDFGSAHSRSVFLTPIALHISGAEVGHGVPPRTVGNGAPVPREETELADFVSRYVDGDAILNDPFARAIAGEKAVASVCVDVASVWTRRGVRPAMHERESAGMRAVWLRAAVAEIDRDQVVLLAPGLDTAGHALIGADVFEVDDDTTLSLKEYLIRTKTAHLRSKANSVTYIYESLLSSAWPAALLRTHFDTGKQTTWMLPDRVIEDFENEARERILRAPLLYSAPGSTLVLCFRPEFSFESPSARLKSLGYEDVTIVRTGVDDELGVVATTP